jgi:hypothetical protein
LVDKSSTSAVRLYAGIRRDLGKIQSVLLEFPENDYMDFRDPNTKELIYTTFEYQTNF